MAIMMRIREEADKLGFAIEMTPKGNAILTLPGAESAPEGTLALSAHVDTLGAMVRSIKPNGMLRFTPVGGYAMQSVEGEYCLVHTRDGRIYEGTVLATRPSVHVYSDMRELKREEANMEIRLDEAVAAKEETEKLGIAPGDFISWDPRTRVLPNGWIKSRHLDDKASVAALFGVLEWFKREGAVPARPVKLVFSVYEEVGHGSSYLPPDITELIAVDMGAIGDDLSATERDVSICAKDSSGPYDYEMTSSLIALARAENLPHAVDIYPHYGSDASAALRGGANIRAALIGPGVHGSHGMERTHADAVVNTAALLIAYIMESRRGSFMSNLTQRPAPEEFGAHFGKYIEIVPDGSIVDILAGYLKSTAEFLSDIPQAKGEYRYEPGKWSLKQVIGHISDTERVMSYRLLRIARGDSTPLPGFDQDAYVSNVDFDAYSLSDLIEDYISVRRATMTLVRGLADDAWSRMGTASSAPMSARALAYVIAGHELHHLRILKEKYLV
jgi:putative aminopeptidase FrvX